MSGHDGKRNQMKGRAMSMKQKSPKGLENYFPYHYAPCEPVFWAPIGHPIAHLRMRLKDMKGRAMKGTEKT